LWVQDYRNSFFRDLFGFQNPTAYLARFASADRRSEFEFGRDNHLRIGLYVIFTFCRIKKISLNTHDDQFQKVDHEKALITVTHNREIKCIALVIGRSSVIEK
jgi:hypothetical protein